MSARRYLILVEITESDLGDTLADPMRGLASPIQALAKELTPRLGSGLMHVITTAVDTPGEHLLDASTSWFPS